MEYSPNVALECETVVAAKHGFEPSLSILGQRGSRRLEGFRILFAMLVYRGFDKCDLLQILTARATGKEVELLYQLF